MPASKNITFAIVGSLLVGIIIGASGIYLQQSSTGSEGQTSEATDKQPLYWVAPMDDNYRRDAPGKSPMGMDLVPVYGEQTTAKHDPGAVTIAPHVVNNLGVRTAPVTIDSMHSTITTVGYVQYDQDHLVHIHPRVEGWVDKLYVKAAGNPVKQGEPLYQLYSPQLVNAQEEFLIALKRNNKALIAAAKERLAALQLSASFIAELEHQQTVKQSVTFYAPKTGVVDGLKIREGFFVKPGTTIMSIGQLEQVWVEAEIFERDAASVQAGLPVTMTLDYLPARRWSGVVDYVYPTLDAQNRTLRVRLKFDNRDLALKPNMFAQVAIQVNEITSAILVPKESVIRTGKQDRVVLALGAGQFKSIAVKIGRVADTYIEITDGLAANDVVVTSAQFLIDSESSKSSDFKRMYQQPTTTKVSSATVNGVINSIDVPSRTLNISREAIEKWSRPAATMNFILDDNVDITALSPSMEVTFRFEVREELTIVAIKTRASMDTMNHAEHLKLQAE